MRHCGCWWLQAKVLLTSGITWEAGQCWCCPNTALLHTRAASHHHYHGG